MKNTLRFGNSIYPPPCTNFFVLAKVTLFMILYSFLPGISLGQCPTSYTGHLQNDATYGGICGFRQIDVAIDLNNLSDFDCFGTITINFSANVKILNYSIQTTGLVFDSYTSDHVINFDIGDVCEPVTIYSNVALVRLYYTLISGSSATVQTSNTRLARGCITLCTNANEASAQTLNLSAVELNGNIIAPGEFSCTGGNSTDNGLPDRFVNVNMANSPFWNICEDIETNGYGYYECSELRDGCDYTVCVSGPEDDFCGIDEFDQDIIRDLVLGNICPFDYKWQHYAADANNDGVVSTADITCLERYLHDETPYNMPYKWKYVSNIQYDAFTPICDPAEDRIYVPAVDNCSNINMDDDPIIEDWYGFPVGDLNHTCNSCGFKSNLPILNRNIANSIHITLLKRSEQIISLEFNHNAPINVWSLTLTPDIPVENIKSVNLLNSKGLYWNIDTKKNLLKLSFVELQNQEFIGFALKINLKNGTKTNPANWSINAFDTRLNNIAIDKNKEVFPFIINAQKFNDNYSLFLNPTTNILTVNGNGDELLDYSIFQLDGKLLLHSKNISNQISTETLNPGIYFLQLKFETRYKSFRFTKFD